MKAGGETTQATDGFVRPLPVVNDENAHFWRGGVDGVLRFSRCNACAALLHPPPPVCRYCRSQDIGVAGVSGRGVVVGVTVNHQLWDPRFPPPSDVQVAELYDGFTFNCVSWLEALGFCGIGEAKDFLDGGKAIARDGGVVALNTHGGQLSARRTHGMGLLHEAVVQLRGEGGARQVAGAQVAVVSSGGLTPAGAILLRRDS
jgi:uncharacterized OB-fold protein